jgi:hypothetical protein
VSDIKSAWEIAQEKASKLGGLSLQEREEQRQEKCNLIGAGVTEKYLSGHDIEILKDEIGKYEAADKDLVAGAAVRRLSQAIDLQYPSRLPEILQGLLLLKNNKVAKKTLDEIKELFQEYATAEVREIQEIEKAAGEILHQIRASGSAVSQINIRAKEEWQNKLDQTARPFNDRLNSLKQELMR